MAEPQAGDRDHLIDAVAQGKRVAAAIDAFLGGDGIVEEAGPGREEVYDGSRESGFADRVRLDPPVLPVAERRGVFREVELCFDDASAVEEARRCLDCDLENDPLRLILPE